MASKKPNRRRSQNIFLALDKSEHKVYLNSVELVRQVEKYPAIYNYFIQRNQLATFSSWEAIICELLPEFPSMQMSYKSEIRTNVRLRWRYMRTVFRRDFTRKYRKHIEWLDDMKFITPYLRLKSKTPSEHGPVDSKYEVAASVVKEQIPLDVSSDLLPALISSESEFIIETFINAHYLADETKSTDGDLNFLFALFNALQKMTHQNKVLLKDQINIIINF